MDQPLTARNYQPIEFLPVEHSQQYRINEVTKPGTQVAA
jgi:hypothetical protein